ncbi:M23 family metallopeptidase [Nocardioides yefusunii]|uniref:Peptidoglycan DD-metalloendopeptidase family protein n=1 Tax=Nocardioides yefusunii TaxID=2500546 RepID=A0ABW1QX51_9ACTN|nr:M23 family metallopeptidase [Nocardioides yefusunii]
MRRSEQREAPSFWTHLTVATATVSLAAVTALGLGITQAEAGSSVAKTKASAKAATLVPTVNHQFPFVCGSSWTTSTRANHSPSSYAVDFNAPNDAGQPVVASARGTVTKADNSSTTGYGRHVVINHGNGETTLYAHLEKVFVTVGVTVDQGTLLGNLGTTGNSSGAHLHYEQKIGSSVVPAWFNGTRLTYGSATSKNCADVPVGADLLEGGSAEIAVFRRNDEASYVVRRNDGASVSLAVGRGYHQPVVGDWDGDGQLDTGTYDPRTHLWTLAGEAGFRTIKSGARGDRPVAGDWDADGVWETGVRRGSNFRLKGDTGKITVVPLGDVDDLPVTGDWNGDGVTDLGVYDPATSVFTLRTVVNGKAQIRTVAHGAAGDLPAVGDWNGDGVTDLGTWTPSLASFSQRLLTATSMSKGVLGRTTVVKWGKKR